MQHKTGQTGLRKQPRHREVWQHLRPGSVSLIPRGTPGKSKHAVGCTSSGSRKCPPPFLTSSSTPRLTWEYVSCHIFLVPLLSQSGDYNKKCWPQGQFTWYITSTPNHPGSTVTDKKVKLRLYPRSPWVTA